MLKQKAKAISRY